MKKLFGTITIALLASVAVAQSTQLTVTFKFINIVEGYDHNCKSEIFIDGESVAVSDEAKESVGTTFTASVPMGQKDFRLVNYAEYEGNWEEHTIENDYSIDCVYEDGGHKFGKKAEKLYIIFDIDSQTYASWVKKIKGTENYKVVGKG
jgi:hypothetical protein